ncbi:MAG TPA: aspartate--tRNA(Asn) ligase [Micromonosporaceae bacterium]
MQRTLSAHLPTVVGETVTVAGWVHRHRRLKSVEFLIIRDRTGLAQVVLPPSSVDAVAGLTEESLISVTGLVRANAAAPAGVEVAEATVRVLSAAGPPPFDLYRPTLRAGLPTLLDHAPVALRHPARQAVFRAAAAAVRGFRSTLDALGFTEVQTPKIIASASESGANVFRLDYFGRPAYLAQSPQFFKQAMVGVFERVYEVGPVFRAEPHDTVRHLAQYTSLDVEMGFITDHRDVMALVRSVLAGMLESVGSFVEVRLPEEIPVVHFVDALRMAGGAPDEPDLAPAHERWLGDWALREHGSDFLFVAGYPMAKRPFYTHPDPARPGYTNGFDLLFRGMELITGGQRLHRYDDYVSALAARGESTEPYASYLSVFRHGMPPHGGFAIGLERFLMRLTGAANIREVTLFPRDLTRLTP